MMFDTSAGVLVDEQCLLNYLDSLINRFFKILPIRESDGKMPVSHMASLQYEILGCKNMIVALNYDESILSLASTLQYLIDTPDINIKDVKKEVFRTISICEKLKKKFCGGDAG